jgi:hypothetical protein
MPISGKVAAPVVNILKTNSNILEDCKFKGLRKIPWKKGTKNLSVRVRVRVVVTVRIRENTLKYLYKCRLL